jgi:hypothetical protein
LVVARKSNTPLELNPCEPGRIVSGPCVDVVAGVGTPPVGLMTAMICGDGTDVNVRLCGPLPVAFSRRVKPEPLALTVLIVSPEGMPVPLTTSPGANSLVLVAITAFVPLVIVPSCVKTVPGTGTVGAGRPVVVVKV